MNKKTWLIAVGIILAVCLTLVMVSQSMPVKSVQEKTLVNYNHRGDFSYTAYSVSQSAHSNPVLFPQIIDSMTIYFLYLGEPSDLLSSKVVLENMDLSWQKSFVMTPTVVEQNKDEGTTLVSFPLKVDEILTLGNTISEQIGQRGSSYYVSVISEVSSDGAALTSTFSGELNASYLIWESGSFVNISRGFPGEDNMMLGVYGYSVQMKDNDLYGRIVLENKPGLPKLQEMDPASGLFTSLVKSMDISYDYSLTSDADIQSLSVEVELELVLGETDRWTRTWTVLPETEYSGPVSVSVPLDIGKLKAMAASIDESIEGKTVNSQNISLIARVHTVARTSDGVIDESITQQMTGTMGDSIVWGNEDTGDEELSLVKNGKITSKIESTDQFVKIFRIVAIILFAVVLCLFGLLIFRYLKSRPAKTLDDILKQNLKKYGALISEIDEFPQASSETRIVEVPKLESVINIANNSLNPVLLKIENNRHTYCVIKDNNRYVYTENGEAEKEIEHTENAAKPD